MHFAWLVLLLLLLLYSVGGVPDAQLRLLSYAELVGRLHALAARAPSIVELFSAQDRYGIASPGSCGGEPCKHWFVSISNRSSSSGAGPWDAPLPQRPQLFLSGNWLLD